MDDPQPQSGQNTIVFRFRGGSRDGDVVRSDRPDGEQEAQALWVLTWNGTIGRRFDAATANGPAYQRYQVKSRYDVDGETHVTCEHVS